MAKTKARNDGWDHTTRDLLDGTTIRHGDTVLVEAEYTQSDRPPNGRLDDPPGPDDKLWLNVQGHAPIMVPLCAVRALPTPQTRMYTVIGVHDGGQGNRFAESYEDICPGGAEDKATAEHPDLLISGVVEGECELVDDDPTM
jgi:hypothetical protein